MKNDRTTIELFIIEAVKKKRKERKIRPNKLSQEIGLARGIIGKIEKFEDGYKYNANQLNEIAKVLGCKIADFFPEPYVKQDCLEEYHTIREEKKKQAVEERIKKSKK